MTRRLWLCMIGVLLSFSGFAIQALPNFKVYYAPAPGSDTLQPYVEVYWQIDPTTVNYIRGVDSFWKASIITKISVTMKGKEIAGTKYMLNTTPASSISVASRQNIIDLYRFSMPAGTAEVNITLLEKGYEHVTYTHSQKVTVDPAPEYVFYSKPQLLDTTYLSSEQSIFLKNDRHVIPLSADFLDDYRKTVTWYTELYNTKNIGKDRYPLVQESFISKTEVGEAVYKLQKTDTITAISDQVYVSINKFNIGVLPSGNFHLNNTIRDKDGIELASTSLFIQRSNTTPDTLEKPEQKTETDTGDVFEKVTIIELEETFVGKYNLPQTMAILKMLLPISSQQEAYNIKSFQGKPDEKYMKYFILNFWKARNEKDPEQAWKKYVVQIKEVNDLFSTGLKRGYESDRGYMYLKYGKPEVRLTVRSEEGALPYEVWQYNAPGNQSRPGVILFYQPEYMIGDYKILHTTINGEVRNTSWRLLLYPNGQGNNNSNSRAEEFLKNN